MQHASPLLMVHGLFGPLRFFDPASLLTGIQVITPDLPGYAQQPALPQVSLAAQAEAVVAIMRSLGGQRCHLLGHSVGGAVAFLAATRAPELVQSIISVEGNFTLDDAFMCRRIAPLKSAEWAHELSKIQSDPAAWLRKGGIEPTPQRLSMAHCILHNQSAATLQAMARAVVKETAGPEYLEQVRQLLMRGIPIHLLAGSRSVSGWHVPEWMRERVSSDAVLPGCGHMMMLERPKLFCDYLRQLLYPANSVHT